jgi:tetratricopeptide (TPR) repeat protein
MNSSMATMISTQAKDFWSWRTGPFEFERAIEYQPIDRPQQFESTTYSDDPIADPAEIEQQIKTLLADDPESPLLRSLYQSLGIAYQKRTEQGKTIDYAQEQQLGIEALKKAIELQEPSGETLDLANSFNSLAELYRPMGRYQEAEELLNRSLTIRTKNLGRSHPDIARNLNDLAVIYEAQGQYNAAEPLYIEALKIRKEQLGDRHPDTATSLNNLAELYSSMGQYDRALPLFESALEIRKSELGDRHPDTATSLNNLAGLYRSMGEYDRALPLYESALEICKSELGDRHPSTATSLNNLAGLYFKTDRLSEAITMMSESVKIFEQSLGTKHPNTIQGKKNLALFQKKLKDSEVLKIRFDAALKKQNTLQIPDKSTLFTNKSATPPPIDWKSTGTPPAKSKGKKKPDEE